MNFIFILIILLGTPLFSLDIAIDYISKDGIYLNIGKKNNLKIGDTLTSKSKNKKIRIISISESHSIACLLKNNKCEENFNEILKIKNMIFILNKEKIKKSEELFVREDKELFEEIPKDDIELFNSEDKVFKLVIFDESTQKREKKSYELYGSITSYNIGKFELLEYYHTLSSIIAVDITYKINNHKAELLFDINGYFDKDFKDFSLNIYNFDYEYKYKNFKIKFGRDNVDQLNDFYIVDGLFINWKNSKFKAGSLLSFGVDYYKNMKTDFSHIYTGGYFGINKTNLFDKISSSLLVALIPEFIYDDSLILGVLPVYLNTKLFYGDLIDILYQFKFSNTLLGPEGKNIFMNHYLAFNITPTKKMAFRLGFDSRDYLDLINKKYYKTIAEKIDNDISKNIYTNFIYRFKKDSLLLSYKYRFDDNVENGISNTQLFTLRYLMRFNMPLEISLRATALLLPDVDQFFVDFNINYMFNNDLRVAFNLPIMFEKISVIDDKYLGFSPQLEIYKKFSSYFYIKSNASFELRSKRVDVMFKAGYIFK